jgi:predicted dehydrogenase
MVEFENGALGTITSTRFATGYSNRVELRIFGDKGAVKIEFDNPLLPEGSKFMFTDDINREFSSKEDKLRWKTIETPPTMNNFEKFIDSIKNNIIHKPDFNRGAEIQNILDKCAKSSDSDSWVDV